MNIWDAIDVVDAGQRAVWLDAEGYERASVVKNSDGRYRLYVGPMSARLGYLATDRRTIGYLMVSQTLDEWAVAEAANES